MSFGAATKELKSRSEARAKRCRLEQLRVQGLVRGSCTHKTKLFSRKPCSHKTLEQDFVFVSCRCEPCAHKTPVFKTHTKVLCGLVRVLYILFVKHFFQYNVVIFYRFLGSLF